MIPYYDKEKYKELSTEIIQFIDDIATNYDHREDAHKYNTPCFVCDAEELVTKLNINYPLT